MIRINYEEEMAIRNALYKQFGVLPPEEINKILNAFRTYTHVSLEEKLFAIKYGYKSLAHAMADKIIDDRRN